MAEVDLTKISLAQLPELLAWIVEHRIGNWEAIFSIISIDPAWHSNKDLVLVCTNEDATFLLLKWPNF